MVMTDMQEVELEPSGLTAMSWDLLPEWHHPNILVIVLQSAVITKIWQHLIYGNN